MDEVKLRVVDLDLNDVLPNRFQPRIKFSEDSIIELSESIKEHGVIQPIVVRPIGDKYEIIAGERRYKASVLAGKDTIPAIITDLNDKDSAEVALIENVQRKDLSAIEEAISYKKILDMGYLTQEQLAIKLGKSQSTVANKIRLLNLCDEVQEALMEDKISERHARSMLKLSTAEKQRIMLDKIIKERLTVRKTDEEIDKMNTYINTPVETPTTPVSNPGFVDVDKIANNAQDLKFEDSAGNVNINALLQGNNSPIVSSTTQDIPSIPTIESSKDIFNASPIEPVPVIPVVPETPQIEPTQVIPGVPTTLDVPTILTTPVADSVTPVSSAFNQGELNSPIDSKTSYDLPPVPLVDPFQSTIEPPKETSSIEETVTPELSTVSSPIESVPVIPVEPVTPSLESTSVIPEVPTNPDVQNVLINKIDETVVPKMDSSISTPVVESSAPVSLEIKPSLIQTVEPVSASSSTLEIPSVIEEPAPVLPKIPTITPVVPEIPTITPVVPEISPIASMPSTPIVEDTLPARFLPNEENDSDNDATETPGGSSETKLVEIPSDIEPTKPEVKAEEIRPIIITDYSKQYDPVIPNATPAPARVDFKQIINLIRDVNSTIEKCGYTIETEEYDLEGVYQVIFKINKD